ncbi:MAG: cyclic nucleotide-binding domain-containing protein [Acidimicrobiales bacterium]|jgi:NAD(P)H-flavin reductase
MPKNTAALVGDHPFLAELPDDMAALVRGCARSVTVRTGEYLLLEGDAADVFYLIRRGQVSLETRAPGRPPLVIETLGPGTEIGWSWLFPPYRWQFDARATEPVEAIAVDAICLRGKVDADPALGYELTKKFAAVMLSRLQAARLRLSVLHRGGRMGRVSEARRQLDRLRTIEPVVEPEAAPTSAFVPEPYRVVAKHEEAEDVYTISLEPAGQQTRAFRVGQFNMLTAFGVGEAAISVSSAPGTPGRVEHTVRDVGTVTHALCSSPLGSVIGVRGPFGTDWGIEDLAGQDVVIIAGGIGLAPLRGAVFALLDAMTAKRAARARRGVSGPVGRVVVLIGARSPDQIIFTRDIWRWREQGAEVHVTVDLADQSWTGPVGVVTTLLTNLEFEPGTSALVCGPEIMMRFSARALLDKGLQPENIRISLERNMQCGIGLCGHCQLGPLLLCQAGRVLTYSNVVPHLLSVPEL